MLVMHQKQRYFNNVHIMHLECNYIVDLDASATDVNGSVWTVRQFIMDKAPPSSVTDRIFVSVSKKYNSDTYVLTTVAAHADHAANFLASMIPESRARFGAASDRWWTTGGRLAHANVRWDKKKGLSLTDEFDVTAILADDPFEMNDAWKTAQVATTIATTNPPSAATPAAAMSATVSDMMQRRAQDDDQSLGVYTGRPPELSRYHVIRCQHPDAVTIFHTTLHNLELWLTKRQTHPDLRHTILGMLRSWYDNRPWNLPYVADPVTRSALAAQIQLGPHALIDGLLHSSWTTVQSQYYRSLGSRRTGFRWHSQLVRRIWEIAWTLWDHREAVRRSPESLSLARQHDEANGHILLLFSRACEFPPSAARWFSRSPDALFAETLDRKRLWLEAVRSFPPSIPM